MNRYVKPPRECAARALCNLDGNPPDAMYEGVSMWRSYMPQVDAVLRVALGDEAWTEMIEAEKAGAAGSP